MGTSDGQAVALLALLCGVAGVVAALLSGPGA